MLPPGFYRMRPLFISLDVTPLLQCRDMADWRQIQARIRKAKNSPDAPAKLNELFQRTRDGMVAWELAALEEKAEHREEAGRWYTIAAQRFRRPDWRKKAEEALTRLGMEIPAHGSEPASPPPVAASYPAPHAKAESGEGPFAEGEQTEVAEESAADEGALADGAAPELQPAGLSAASAVAQGEGLAGGKRKRRRGRRGGRGRHGKGRDQAQGLPSQSYARSAEPQSARPSAAPLHHERPSAERTAAAEAPAALERAARPEPPTPQLPSERAAHGRGDPALASRMAHLESLLRRLVQSPLHRLDDCDDAPAGPGVILLSDSEQTSSYYIEACQTLRIGAANLVRGGRSGNRGGRGQEAGLKSRLAEYLGINEAKVSQYMKDHCVLRWIQLDDEAPLLAHFAIGVLRTPLNLE
jgi:hypothetical protein